MEQIFHSATGSEDQIPWIEPENLKEGIWYMWVERGMDGKQKRQVSVKLVMVTSCPAVVLLEDMTGARIQGLRSDLFCLP